MLGSYLKAFRDARNRIEKYVFWLQGTKMLTQAVVGTSI